jgi:exodeoxyribonuclease-3
MHAHVVLEQRAAAHRQPTSSHAEAQERKDKWAATFMAWTAAYAASDSPVVLGGDLNIAHTANDIHNPTANRKNSGFMDHERAWFSDLLDQGWNDMVRTQLGDIKGPYSWWSNRGEARKLNRGWRIDYLLGNAAAAARLTAAGIERKGGLTVSDHAPVWIDLQED